MRFTYIALRTAGAEARQNAALWATPLTDLRAGSDAPSSGRHATAAPEGSVVWGSLLSGLLVGFNLLGQAVALSGLLFAGALSVGIGTSTTLLIACCAVSTAVLWAVRGMPQTAVGALQNVPIAALIPAAYVLSSGAVEGLSPAEGVASMFALLGLGAITLGLAMLGLSALDLGRIVRLMPHPVAAGFLASAGMVLILAALYRVGNTDSPELSALFRIAPQNWLPLMLALGLAVLIRVLARWRADLGPVVGILLGLVGFYALLAWQGLSAADARLMGYLPGLVDPTDTVAWSPDLYQNVNWAFVSDHLPLVLVAALIGVLGTMLNFTGIELALRSDIDTRRALAVTGLSNIGLGLGGGSISYLSSVNSISANALGARGSLSRVVLLALLGAGLIWAQDIVAYTPTFVATALLIYIGYNILSRWLLSQRAYQTRADWSIAASIVGVTMVFGILPAIALGIVAASLIFAISYARLPVITSLKDLSGQRSTVDRGPSQSALLDREADQVLTLAVRGYLFFGSVEQVLDHVRAVLARPNKPQRIILDMRRVSAMDSAALVALQKLEFLAEHYGSTIVIAEPRPNVAAALIRVEGQLTQRGTVVFASSVDIAIEDAEEMLLDNATAETQDATAFAVMEDALDDPELAARLLAEMQREEVVEGQTLITYGESSEDIFIIDSGRMAVMAPNAGGQRIRVRSLRPGAIVGEIASYAGLPRTADVVAESDGTVYRIGPDELEEVLGRDPYLAAAWHKMIAVTLSEKIHRTTQMLRESM